MVERVAFALNGHAMSENEFTLSDEAAEWIGQKKSEYLSKLIKNLKAGDFGFEDFHRYDHLIKQTMESPDHVYDLDSDYPIRTYIKTYADKAVFHQLIIGAVFPDKNNEVFVPILTMVTKFQEVAKLMEEGTPSRGPVLN
jgi:hypothetical protein